MNGERGKCLSARKAKSLCALSQPLLLFCGESKAICLGGRATFGAFRSAAALKVQSISLWLTFRGKMM